MARPWLRSTELLLEALVPSSFLVSKLSSKYNPNIIGNLVNPSVLLKLSYNASYFSWVVLVLSFNTERTFLESSSKYSILLCFIIGL